MLSLTNRVTVLYGLYGKWYVHTGNPTWIRCVCVSNCLSIQCMFIFVGYCCDITPRTDISRIRFAGPYTAAAPERMMTVMMSTKAPAGNCQGSFYRLKMNSFHRK